MEPSPTYVLANWKMYPDRHRAVELFATVQARLRERRAGMPAVIVCPPFVWLPYLRAMTDPRLMSLGAQNCHWEPEGPYTGEVSAPMLRDLVDYVLVGHSERRAMGESDEQIARKVAAVVAAGLTPIVFVGEDEPTDRALEQTEERLATALAAVDVGQHAIMVVYEPTWAIGADRPATAEHVRGVVEQLKRRLAELGDATPRVLYGGTVNADNVAELAAIAELDGVGATRGSLDVDGFLRIVDRVAELAAGGPQAR